ncbi:MAG TPA: transporter associated domain-containing protein [Gammaproteobacteria bacterium]|nr:transporter associated domain-containing protein [Gammaproteobacteria bacterium]
MTDEETSSTESTGITGWWARLFQGRDEIKGRDEISAFLAECRRQDLLAPDEYAMMRRVLEVSHTQVRDIMVPRSHMVVLPKDDLPETLLETIVESGHSRFPVIGEDRDEVVGMLLAKDLLKHFAAGQRGFDIEKFLRPAVFVPESKRLNTLLTEFRQSHNHMAIVVDEYGGVSGLATIEDVLEQIVGEIDDEHDPEEADPIQEQGDGRYQVLALTRIEDFNEYFGASLSDEEYDTIGGLVMHELGRLPRRGEQLDFGGFRFRVLRGDRRRVHSVEVVRLPLAAEG